MRIVRVENFVVEYSDNGKEFSILDLGKMRREKEIFCPQVILSEGLVY